MQQTNSNATEPNVRQHSQFYHAQDGLRLHMRIFEPRAQVDDLLPVVCLPGLTRNVRDFEALAQIIAGDEKTPRRVIAFDYRGRGLSEYDKDWTHYNIGIEAADVIAGLTVLDVEKACFIGTSRGGLIMHLLAAMRPGLLGPMVMNDVGPVIGGAGLAQIRATLSKIQPLKSWDQAEKMVAMGHAKNFPAINDADIARMARAVFKEQDDGTIIADFDPALLNGLKDIDFNVPLPTLWPQFMGLKASPLLIVRGALSLLLTQETLYEMLEKHGNAKALIIEGQGHAPLLETGTIPQKIMDFFNKNDALPIRTARPL